MADPLSIHISSYKEDRLIQGTLRSIQPLLSFSKVLIFEGPTSEHRLDDCPDTNLGHWITKYGVHTGEWETEAAKRNEMLELSREYWDGNFWILTIDADEILVWGEYLIDWLNALKPGYPESEENVASLKMTVPGWEGEKRELQTFVSPSRLLHSSMIERYEIGLLKIRTPTGQEGWFDTLPSQGPPFYGEPHIHHRYYLRRPERANLRGYELEYQERARELEKGNRAMRREKEKEKWVGRKKRHG